MHQLSKSEDDSRALMLGGAIFAAAFGFFLLEHSAIAEVNGWWFDELFSIWSSNPAEPFSTVFMGRIEPDTTPPLYGSLLYWVRTLIKDDRQAIFVLNTSAIVIAAIAVILSARKAGWSRVHAGARRASRCWGSLRD
jgi:hypothetical protein